MYTYILRQVSSWKQIPHEEHSNSRNLTITHTHTHMHTHARNTHQTTPLYKRAGALVETNTAHRTLPLPHPRHPRPPPPHTHIHTHKTHIDTKPHFRTRGQVPFWRYGGSTQSTPSKCTHTCKHTHTCAKGGRCPRGDMAANEGS